MTPSLPLPPAPPRPVTESEVIHQLMRNSIPVAIKLLEMAQDESLTKFQAEVHMKAAVSILNQAHI